MGTEILSGSRASAVGPHSTISEVRTRHQEIARAEFRKQRKRLGTLSVEQESAIEALLISAVNQLSHTVLDQMRRLNLQATPAVSDSQ
jgi:hypothetical protein